MKYFFDTEFLEGKQRLRKTFLEALFATKIYTVPTIDLISIGIIAEDGREYYAISKDFNLREAWFRYDLLEANTSKNHSLNNRKVYWLRDNVLKPIFKDLWYEKCHLKNLHHCTNDFTYSNFKKLIGLYGKSNSQIANEIKSFVEYQEYCADVTKEQYYLHNAFKNCIEFYGYYSDYDWVVFCWLFGKMIDLPKGFPMYCKDLKQILDEKEYSIPTLKDFNTFPVNYKEHNALEDARWNKKLFKFLQSVS